MIAATNQPLEALVAKAGFRPDLYYRLNVVRLDLPPLKDRPEDIPELFQYAVNQLNAREHRNVGAPDEELIGSLMAHDWPGNVRELNNLVEAIFVDPPDGPIGLRHLPPVFRQIFANYRFSPDIERTRLISALEETNWNKAEAAKRLNWSRMTLYRKLSLYRLDRST